MVDKRLSDAAVISIYIKNEEKIAKNLNFDNVVDKFSAVQNIRILSSR